MAKKKKKCSHSKFCGEIINSSNTELIMETLALADLSLKPPECNTVI